MVVFGAGFRPEVNVASASIPKDRWSARIALVEHYIRLENEHDLEGVLRTFLGMLHSTMMRRGRNTTRAGAVSGCFTSS
jgi:hypothetical protein